jgi:hypothetical protein
MDIIFTIVKIGHQLTLLYAQYFILQTEPNKNYTNIVA